jgi:hypothetical protein
MPLTDKNADEYASGLELSDEDFEHTLVLTQPKRNGIVVGTNYPFCRSSSGSGEAVKKREAGNHLEEIPTPR